MVGNKYLVAGYRLMGVEGYEINEKTEVRKLVENLISRDEYSIILIEEDLMAKVEDVKNMILSRGKITPLFIPVPGLEGSKNRRIAELYRFISEAMGVKLKSGVKGE